MTKTKKPRCAHCNKKLGIIRIECKCSNIYCITCQLPETHKCTYDFKQAGKKQLVEKLTKVTNIKVPLI